MSPLCPLRLIFFSAFFLAGCGGHHRNPRIDAIVDQIRTETDREKRKALCSQVQKNLANDLPYLPLWFTDVISVNRRSLGDLQLSPTGDYDFLDTVHPAVDPK